MTRYPELFAALAAPFGPSEVKTRPQGKQQLRYITARTAMNRLDQVLGPENWWDKPTMLSDSSFLCELTIRLPDGATVTKCDVGGMAGMADAGDDDKSGASDAFKRAAVKFGVARYLYRDGVPSYGDPAQTHGSAPAAREEGPTDPAALAGEARGWLQGEVAAVNRRWKAAGNEHVLVAAPERALNALISEALRVEFFKSAAVAKKDNPAARSPARCWAALGWLRTHQAEWTTRALSAYFERKRREARRALEGGEVAAEDESQEAPETEEALSG